MGLLENIITLVNKYFYKTEEKPAKYNEWLTSEYVNGKWYICEENIPPIPTILDMGWEIEESHDMNDYLYFIIYSAINIPYEMYDNIELNTTDLPTLDCYYSSNRINFDASQSFPNSYTIICTIPTTTINNNIYIGCQIIWTGSELIIQ